MLVEEKRERLLRLVCAKASKHKRDAVADEGSEHAEKRLKLAPHKGAKRKRDTANEEETTTDRVHKKRKSSAWKSVSKSAASKGTFMPALKRAKKRTTPSDEVYAPVIENARPKLRPKLKPHAPTPGAAPDETPRLRTPANVALSATPAPVPQCSGACVPTWGGDGEV
ncbi:hypothetical protein DFH09DRAFT_1324894 [Mycena vulgaris]|nr:hypothetical protein DFH09DRAFT_1324894 [Mycena vulgaris]